MKANSTYTVGHLSGVPHKSLVELQTGHDKKNVRSSIFGIKVFWQTFGSLSFVLTVPKTGEAVQLDELQIPAKLKELSRVTGCVSEPVRCSWAGGSVHLQS